MNIPNVLDLWKRAHRLPAGGWVFSRGLGLVVPYAATLRAEVTGLAPGVCVVRMKDRRAVRNHLGSIHAAALVNLAELAGNLALSTLQPADGRWILRGPDVDFTRKARGTLTARCTVEEGLDWRTSRDVDGQVAVTDASGHVVLQARPRWRTGPVEKSREAGAPHAAAA